MSALSHLDGRLNRIEAVLTSLGSSERTSEPVADREAPRRRTVTHEELARLLEQTERRMEGHVAQQFGNQMLAIDSLRAMIVDTDMLLERVLSRLDSSSFPDAEDSSRDAEEQAGTFADNETLIARENVARENPAGKKPISTSGG
jgi:hypothetical protein